MPSRRSVLALPLVLALAGYSPAPALSEARPRPEVMGVPLDGIGKEFRADPYLRAAAALQARGKDAACLELMTMARRSGQDQRANEALIVLCRMLFAARQGEPLRGPRLGLPRMVGQAQGVDTGRWPLEPITLVDVVPFCLTYGYDRQGQAEPADEYLAYCIVHGDWTTTRYAPASNAKMRQALSQLLNSPRWERPLEPTEREFLEAQIRPSTENSVAASPVSAGGPRRS